MYYTPCISLLRTAGELGRGVSGEPGCPPLPDQPSLLGSTRLTGMPKRVRVLTCTIYIIHCTSSQLSQYHIFSGGEFLLVVGETDYPVKLSIGFFLSFDNIDNKVKNLVKIDLSDKIR